MKSEEEVRAEISELEKDLAVYKRRLKENKDPRVEKDLMYDVSYIRHYIQHLKWVLK